MDTSNPDIDCPPVIRTPDRAELAPIAAESPVSSPKFNAGVAVLAVLVLLSVLAVIGVTGYFRLSSETAALRKSAMAAVPGVWDKKVAVRIGWFTTAVIRNGSRFLNLPPELRAALDALHGVDVGVYRRKQDTAPEAYRTLLASADRSMKSHGWERIVGVSKEGALVGIYIPRSKAPRREVRCCVLVLQGRDLVVASASGNLEPLFRMALKRTFREDLHVVEVGESRKEGGEGS